MSPETNKAKTTEQATQTTENMTQTDPVTQKDVDQEAADRISESISEGYINGNLEGF